MTALEQIDLFFSAENLPSLTVLNKADPFAVLFESIPGEKGLKRLKTTEVLQDSLSPHWTTTATLDFRFEEKQTILVQVYHSNGKHDTEDLEKHTFLGQIDFLLSTLMRSAGDIITKQVYRGRNQGLISVRGEPRTHTREIFQCTFCASNLRNKAGMFGTSDPFLVISRLNEDSKWTTVWRGEPVQNSLSPEWARLKIHMATLCNADIDRPLKLEIFDYKSSGNHHFMGEVESSVRLLMLGNGDPMTVLEPKKVEKDKHGAEYRGSGSLIAWNVEIEPHTTLADFLSGGCALSMMVGIDFTASNKDPLDPASLHYLSPAARNPVSYQAHEPYPPATTAWMAQGLRDASLNATSHSSPFSPSFSSNLSAESFENMNQYERAIQSVGDILEPYSADKTYPVFGFGAKLRMPDGRYSPVSHCFPIYEGGSVVSGVAGILQAYRDCLKNVMLSGPTHFAPLICAAAQYAVETKCTQEDQNYTILLILTDGAINDMEETKRALVAASHLPLSIVIVGVGEADFSSMVELDAGDDQSQVLELPNGVRAARDIVQFVAYRDVSAGGMHTLSQQVMREIPEQLLAYMEQNKITPNDRCAGSPSLQQQRKQQEQQQQQEHQQQQQQQQASHPVPPASAPTAAAEYITSNPPAEAPHSTTATVVAADGSGCSIYGNTSNTSNTSNSAVSGINEINGITAGGVAPATFVPVPKNPTSIDTNNNSSSLLTPSAPSMG